MSLLGLPPIVKELLALWARKRRIHGDCMISMATCRSGRLISMKRISMPDPGRKIPSFLLTNFILTVFVVAVPNLLKMISVPLLVAFIIRHGIGSISIYIVDMVGYLMSRS